jgi:hypothetical protein
MGKKGSLIYIINVSGEMIESQVLTKFLLSGTIYAKISLSGTPMPPFKFNIRPEDK